MPRGKELEQLPMAKVAPSAGLDKSPMAREDLSGIVRDEQPEPADVAKENEDMV